MNTQCDNCGVVLSGEDAITNRRGTFCTTDCDLRHAADVADAYVPVLSDEAWLFDPDSPPDLPSFCHP